ncbi:family 71 glycoside hydrolase [Melampsora larici-populina 98AG31]|uniref:Family 71 glycoside hydrolase n=1 Tax=Melampsora larici-populina (strain 98AG31 / pathotype 3-4-7) TaxID=747676 RepID=F4RFS8_MELLP|nr:family 71 glycoside hydrolase [Melampsora larici-populina 98AG31]EGG08877.1 family 71 glycoside hydrolase [Melampsora larici-populina 98AG31]
MDAIIGSSLSEGWKEALKDPLLSLNPPINPLFVPAWPSLDVQSAVSNNPVVDGMMSWLSWPSGTENMTTKVDLQFQKNAKSENKVYMAGVSPCFYTHYPEKNYLFRSDDHLYIKRWKELINMPTAPDFIEIISWNDYGRLLSKLLLLSSHRHRSATQMIVTHLLLTHFPGESHYIGPIYSVVPDGTTWVSAIPKIPFNEIGLHQAWLSMTEYFIKWYKSGTQPPMTAERVYFHYRPHSVNAVASSDSLGPPENKAATTDAVYVATFLPKHSAARQLRVKIGNTSLQTFDNLPLGDIGLFSIPWTGSGGVVTVSVKDGSGNNILKGKGDVEISNTIKTYNFNYAHTLLANDDCPHLSGSLTSSPSTSPLKAGLPSNSAANVIRTHMSLPVSALNQK